MSAFNILKADCECSNCKKFYKGTIQFKYGDTWQYEYQIGDQLKWGGNDIGLNSARKVKIYGVLENNICTICNQENDNNEFDIFIQKNTIERLETLANFRDYAEMECVCC